MRLNRLEFALMNNPVRRWAQRGLEGPLLRRLGGAWQGGVALEVGCGPGVGVGLAIDAFGASRVDGFDLDRHMLSLARRRVACYGSRVRLWVGDAERIAVPDACYDAVFDYGVLHHVVPWRRAVAEVARVLKPGGRLYAEEVFARFIRAPVVRRLLAHPETDRFDGAGFRAALVDAGLTLVAHRELWGLAGWVVAAKPAA